MAPAAAGRRRQRRARRYSAAHVATGARGTGGPASASRGVWHWHWHGEARRRAGALPITWRGAAGAQRVHLRRWSSAPVAARPAAGAHAEGIHVRAPIATAHGRTCAGRRSPTEWLNQCVFSSRERVNRSVHEGMAVTRVNRARVQSLSHVARSEREYRPVSVTRERLRRDQAFPDLSTLVQFGCERDWDRDHTSDQPGSRQAGGTPRHGGLASKRRDTPTPGE
jgi:hypothetical protein